MKIKHFTALLLLFASACGLTAEDQFAWFAKAAANPASYRKNASGNIRTSFDETEKAVRFDVDFTKAGRNWFYPYLMFPAGYDLTGAGKLVFEIRAFQEDSPENKYTNALVMFADGMPRAAYKTPTDKFQKVEIDLAKYVTAPEKVRSIRIGMNPNGGKKLTCLIRNIKLLPAESSSAKLNEAVWGKMFLNPSSWRANASGKTEITANGNAVRFKLSFAKSGDNWCYPYFKFGKGKSLAGIRQIRFKIRVTHLPEGGKIVNRLVMFADGMPRYTYPLPGKEFKTVTIDVAKHVKNPEKVNSIRIGLNTRNCDTVTYEIADLVFLTDQEAEALAVEDFIRAAAPGGIFAQGQRLRFFSAAAFPELSWELRDWKGRTLDKGIWEKGAKELFLKPQKTGYYYLHFSSPEIKLEGKCTFMVVVDPKKRNVNSNSFFALDTAQSQLGRPARDNYRFPTPGWELISDAAKLVGTPIIRERYSYRRTAMEAGKYRWFEYETNADLLKARNIDVLGMYADAPPRVRGKLQNLPADLLETYIYNRDAVRHFKGRVRFWEFWNEPDLSYIRAGAWDYAAAAKAAYLGIRAGDKDAVAVLAGIAWTPLLPYNQLVMDNGLADYFDIFNVHTYRPLCEYGEMMDNVFAFMKKNRINTPVWFTETGSNAEGMGRRQSYMAAYKAHDDDQERILTEYLPKAMILQQFLGVDRNFFFVFGPYNENAGRKDWGMFRRDFTAKPCVAAFSTLSELFAAARCAGTLDVGEKVRGFLYELPDGSQSVALWARSELDDLPNRPNLKPDKPFTATVTLPVKNGTYPGRDVVGTPLTFSAGNNQLNVTVDRYPVYITGLSGLKPDKPFIARKTSNAPERNDLDKTIVIRADFDDRFTLTGDKEKLSLAGKSGGLTIEVYNLSGKRKTGFLRQEGAKFSGIPEKITLEPFSKQVFNSEVTPVFSGKNYSGRLKVTGIFERKPSSPLVIPVLAPGQMLANVRTLDMENMLDPLNWRKNSSGKMNIKYVSEEKAIQFDAVFPDGVGKWVYPEYVLQLPQESLAGATAVSFEIRTMGKRPGQSILMAVYSDEKEHGQSIYFRFPTITEKWEKRTILLERSKIDPEKIKMLRIGMNPKESNSSFQLRNFKVYY